MSPVLTTLAIGAGALLLLSALGRKRGGGGTALAARQRRMPTGPEIPATKGYWHVLPAATRLRIYAQDLANAYLAVGLPEIAVPLAVAHSMFATGAWKVGGPFVWNNNIAVVRAGSSWSGPWHRKSTWEVLDDRGTVDPDDDVRVIDRNAAWRSYPSLVDGARAAVNIWQQHRYARAYQALLAGDPAWTRMLGEAGYYTANPTLFEQGYRARLARVNSLLGGRI